MQDAQPFIKFYSNFIRFNDILVFDDDTLLKEFPNKLIKRLKNSYDTHKGFIILKDAKEYLFKLDNNQRIDYQLRIFKAISIRIITGLIKKSLTITITTSTIHIIPIIEITYISTVKFK